MAASGSQTIQLYYSTSSGTAPVAGNMASGELAINITDGKLYYKDNSGVVQTLATKAATSGSFSDITVSGNATLSSGTANGVLYLNGSKVATSGSALTFDGSSMVLNTSASSDALRITQLGTGNALLVEDSTNPDSTPFVVDNNGRVIQGYTTAILTADDYNGTTRTGWGYQAQSTVSANALFLNWSTTATSGGSVSLGRSRSTTIGTPAVVLSGDSLGGIGFVGDDGTNFIVGASISSAVDGTPGTNDMPGRLVFSTTADGASSPTERLRIDSSGRLYLGTTSASAAGINNRWALTGATTAYGQINAGTVQSDVTSSVTGYFSNTSTVASAFTLANLYHFRAQLGTLGAGSAITSQYGFYIGSGFTEGTNNYGFYSNIASGTGRWNFYANGTADNYFAGNVGIGTSSPGQKLEVAGNILINTSGNPTMTVKTSGAGNNPGYLLTADTNTWGIYGIFSDANDTIQYQYNGSTKLTLTNDGNLGLGVTPSAGYRASIKGNYSSIVGGIEFDNGGGDKTVVGFASATSPSFIISNQSASGVLRFDTNNTERVRIDISGNVGIGTSSPAVKLDVAGAISATAQLTVNTADGANQIRLQTAGVTKWVNYTVSDSLRWYNSADRMTLDSSGNLGIGTSSPLAKLEVWGQTRVASSASSAVFLIDSDATSTNGVNLQSSYYGGAGYGPMKFSTGGSERMRLDSSGNLGIGTTSPAAKLDVVGDIFARASTLRFKDSGNTVQYGAIYGDATSFHVNAGVNNLILYTAGTERARIDSSGNLLVGTTSTTVWNGSAGTKVVVGGSGNTITSLQSSTTTVDQGAIFEGYATGVSSNSAALGSIAFLRSNTSTTALSSYTAFYTNNAGTVAERARITSGGDFVVGKAATGVGTQGFGVYSTGDFEANAGSNPAGYLNRTNDGTILSIRRSNTTVGTISVTTTATAYNTSSDYRLKENIQPMTGALAKVQALKPCTYNWKADGSEGEGFIAHELAEVAPQAVTGEKDAVDADGNPVYQGIDTSFLVATLTAAIQELKAEFDAYKATHP